MSRPASLRHARPGPDQRRRCAADAPSRTPSTWSARPRPGLPPLLVRRTPPQSRASPDRSPDSSDRPGGRGHRITSAWGRAACRAATGPPCRSSRSSASSMPDAPGSHRPRHRALRWTQLPTERSGDAAAGRQGEGSGPSARPLHRERGADPGPAVPPAAWPHAPRLALTADLLQQAERRDGGYGELVERVLGLLDGSYRSADGLDARSGPRRRGDVEPWVLGSSAGESAEAAGELGLRFAASYHVSPATALRAADAYRAAFVPFRAPGTSLPRRLGRRRGGARRRHRQEARRRIRPVGAQHPAGRGSDPLPDARRGAAGTSGPTRTGRWSRTGSTRSSSGSPQAVARPAPAAPRGHRRRRADRDHDHPRPCRPRSLVLAPGRRMVRPSGHGAL